MMVNEDCQYLCSKKYQQHEIDNFKWLIGRDYHYTYYVDELPSAYVIKNDTTAIIKYENGMPVGFTDPQT